MDQVVKWRKHNETQIKSLLEKVCENKEHREYKNDYLKRGRAVIINFYLFGKRELTRLGSEADVERLSKILRDELKFDVDVWNTNDLESYELLHLLKEESKRADHADSDCFLMVLMTHGSKGGILQAYSTEFELEEVIQCFTGDNCPALREKPKIFIVQACRGEESQIGVKVQRFISKGPAPTKEQPTLQLSIPNHSDIVIAQAQYEGFLSFRSLSKGSCFIQSFCDVLERDCAKADDRKDHLLNLLTLTSNWVSHFEFLKFTQLSEAQQEGSDAELDVTIQCQGSEEDSALQLDANVFLNPEKAVPTPKIESKLVKQQPTIVSTLRKFFYLHNKDAKIE